MLDALAGAGAQRLVVVDPHGPSFEAMSAVPVETLSAVPTLAQALGQMGPAPLAVVAPDLGAVRLAERLATTLGAPVAVVQKTRRTATSVRANQVVGEVAGCLPVIVDDMIATGGTIEASVGLLEQHGALPGAVVATSHGLFVGPASERLGRLGLGRLVATDTVASSQTPLDQGPHIERCSVAPLLAAAVARLHGEQPLGDLGVVG